jgi:hypothetical protein
MASVSTPNYILDKQNNGALPVGAIIDYYYESVHDRNYLPLDGKIYNKVDFPLISNIFKNIGTFKLNKIYESNHYLKFLLIKFIPELNFLVAIVKDTYIDRYSIYKSGDDGLTWINIVDEYLYAPNGTSQLYPRDIIYNGTHFLVFGNYNDIEDYYNIIWKIHKRPDLPTFQVSIVSYSLRMLNTKSTLLADNPNRLINYNPFTNSFMYSLNGGENWLNAVLSFTVGKIYWINSVSRYIILSENLGLIESSNMSTFTTVDSAIKNDAIMYNSKLYTSNRFENGQIEVFSFSNNKFNYDTSMLIDTSRPITKFTRLDNILYAYTLNEIFTLDTISNSWIKVLSDVDLSHNERTIYSTGKFHTIITSLNNKEKLLEMYTTAINNISPYKIFGIDFDKWNSITYSEDNNLSVYNISNIITYKNKLYFFINNINSVNLPKSILIAIENPYDPELEFQVPSTLNSSDFKQKVIKIK